LSSFSFQHPKNKTKINYTPPNHTSQHNNQRLKYNTLQTNRKQQQQQQQFKATVTHNHKIMTIEAASITTETEQKIN